MNLPPLLLGATLAFWGWQTDFLSVGALLGVLLEGVRLTRITWESTEDELNRLWNLVTVIFLASAVFAFTTNEGPTAFTEMFGSPGLNTSRVAGESSQKTAASLVQWMPMIFFLFVMAVTLAQQSRVKLRVLSLIARRDRQGGLTPPMANREVHVGWVYFGVCLVSSSINSRTDETFFLGLSALLAWALWSQRSRRFVFPVWACLLAAACGLAYWGQDRLTDLRIFMESFTPQWGWRVGGSRTNPDEDSTSIGQLGRFAGSGRIVIRLEPHEDAMPPSLLRTASYRFFRSATWSASGGREDLDGVSRFDTVPAEPHSSTFVLRRSYETDSFSMATLIEGGVDIVPLPMGAATLQNMPVFTLKTNGLGVVTAEGPGIALFDVYSGRDGSIDSPPTWADWYVPEREREAVNVCIMGFKTPPGQLARQLREVAAFFEKNFEYSLWQKFHWGREDWPTPLARFLISDRRGHCEYFATATVLMLRELGIPARYAVGWAVDEPSGSGYVVRERHAHAWCIYFDESDGQWHDFDTTPASWMDRENERASAFEFLYDVWQLVKYEFLKWRWGQSNLKEYVWWIIGPLLVFLLYRLLRRKPGERRNAKLAGMDRLPNRLGLDSEFFALERRLGEMGFVREPGESQSQLVQRALRDPRVASLREVMQAMLHAHYRLRFDPMGLTSEEREALALRVRQALAHLGQQKNSSAPVN